MTRRSSVTHNRVAGVVTSDEDGAHHGAHHVIRELSVARADSSAVVAGPAPDPDPGPDRLDEECGRAWS
jgi:hypothetical protein